MPDIKFLKGHLNYDGKEVSAYNMIVAALPEGDLAGDLYLQHESTSQEYVGAQT